MSGAVVIGLSGASSSGKSTVAKALQSILPNATIIHQDDFYYPDAQIPYREDIKDYDWDCPEAINFDNFVTVISLLKEGLPFDRNKYVHLDQINVSNEVKSGLSVSPLVKGRLSEKARLVFGNRKIYLVDGFLMFHDERLMKLLDAKLFFQTDYRTLKDRRSSREYTIDAGVWNDPPQYFERCVWPQYYKYHKFLFVNGEDEDLIKSNGGELNQHAKEVLGIVDFRNGDNWSLDQLLEDVVGGILEGFTK